jgi:DNA-binding response OmpR family regulator
MSTVPRMWARTSLAFRFGKAFTRASRVRCTCSKGRNGPLCDGHTMADNLLIIEDERLLALELQRRLSRLGWVVQVAGDLAAARRLLLQGPTEPLVVVADMQLPNGNARDLLAELRRGAGPLGEWVFLTACDTSVDAARALQLGACAFLEKPYEKAELDFAVDSIMRRRERAHIMACSNGHAELDTASAKSRQVSAKAPVSGSRST